MNETHHTPASPSKVNMADHSSPSGRPGQIGSSGPRLCAPVPKRRDRIPSVGYHRVGSEGTVPAYELIARFELDGAA